MFRIMAVLNQRFSAELSWILEKTYLVSHIRLLFFPIYRLVRTVHRRFEDLRLQGCYALSAGV